MGDRVNVFLFSNFHSLFGFDLIKRKSWALTVSCLDFTVDDFQQFKLDRAVSAF